MASTRGRAFWTLWRDDHTDAGLLGCWGRYWDAGPATPPWARDYWGYSTPGHLIATDVRHHYWGGTNPIMIDAAGMVDRNVAFPTHGAA